MRLHWNFLTYLLIGKLLSSFSLAALTNWEFFPSLLNSNRLIRKIPCGALMFIHLYIYLLEYTLVLLPTYQHKNYSFFMSYHIVILAYSQHNVKE